MQLTLVRHGTTIWMERGLTHGRSDAPLSELGILQVQQAAESLRGRHFDAFFSSPTGRAWQTAQMIGQTVGIPPEPLDLIVEQDFGSLEGKRIKPNSGIFLSLRMILRSKIPLGSDGETLNEIYQRAVKFLSLINQYQPKGKVLAVSHSGFINVLLRKITGRRLGYYAIKPASIIEIELDGNHQGRILTPLEVIYLPKKM